MSTLNMLKTLTIRNLTVPKRITFNKYWRNKKVPYVFCIMVILKLLLIIRRVEDIIVKGHSRVEISIYLKF